MALICFLPSVICNHIPTSRPHPWLIVLKIQQRFFINVEYVLYPKLQCNMHNEGYINKVGPSEPAPHKPKSHFTTASDMFYIQMWCWLFASENFTWLKTVDLSKIWIFYIYFFIQEAEVTRVTGVTDDHLQETGPSGWSFATTKKGKKNLRPFTMR